MSEHKSESAKKNEEWMNTKWRPAMGWMYMGVCVFDFVVAPILWTVVQFWETQAANDAFRQWQPMTLQGAGLFHMAMGAVLGLAAWGRTQEKIAGAASTPSIGGPSLGGLSASPIGGVSVPSFGSTTPAIVPPAMPSTDEPTDLPAIKPIIKKPTL